MTLKDVAKTVINEWECGRVLVVWKTGQSWHVDSPEIGITWCNEMTSSREGLNKLRDIWKADPDAILIDWERGIYPAGLHFTIGEIASRIKSRYANGEEPLIEALCEIEYNVLLEEEMEEETK